MADEQPKLLNGPDLGGLAHPKLQRSEGGPASPKTASQGGPVFDFGPGWGFYVKKWFGKYLFKIVLPVIVIIVAMGIFVSRNEAENGEKIMADNETIKIMVLHGDGPALVARRALTEYLKNSPEELTAGQKIFIEEILWRRTGGQKLVAGEEVAFDLNNIKEAISQSKNLSPYQLQVWEDYAKGIKF